MNNKQGFASVFALLVLVGALVAVGFWYQAVHPSTALTATGQTATISNSVSTSGTSTPILAVSLDPTTAPAGQISMGATGNSLATFRLTNLSNQNINVTDLKVFESENAVGQRANFSNLQVWIGSTLLGTASGPTLSNGSSTPAPGYIYTYHLASPIVVPASNSIMIFVRGDLASYSSSGATDGSVDQFRIATSTDPGNTTPQLTVSAFGATTNQSATITLHSPVGKKQQVLRSVLGVNVAPLGGSNHTKSSVDNLGTITMTANPAGPDALTKVVATFSGNMPSSTFLNGVTLVDSNGLSVVTADGATVKTSAPCNNSIATSTCTVTWSFSNNNFIISGGSSYTFTLRVNSTLIPPQPGVAETLTATIHAATDVAYKDGVDSAAINANLSPTRVPITINSVTYPVGQ